MRASVIRACGSAEQLELAEAENPAPTDSETLDYMQDDFTQAARRYDAIGGEKLLHRRRWMLSMGAGAAALCVPSLAGGQQAKKRPRVAAINSIYRLRSHAYHIAGRFIYGYQREGEHHQPPFQLVRMFNHQSPADDLGPEVCAKHGIELCNSVAEALGGDQLDVDAVLLIIEHGDYPVNEFGQILYPRQELFDEIARVFHASRKSVPVFVDKHLSYDHRKARAMVETARKLKFGLMAGSSLPVTWRRPELDPPLGTPFTEGLVAFGYDRGPAEIYFFHALETLQTMLERRAGSETGVKFVTGLKGNAVWQAEREGLWSGELLETALRRNPSRNYGAVREQVKNPQAILIEYTDGTRGAVLNLIEACSEFSFAGRVKNEPQPLSTWFVLPPPPGARFFDALTWNIERFFKEGKPPYPVERTLLTSTVLDLGLRSLHSGAPVASPALAIRYQAPEDDGHMRGRFTDDAENE
jgi:hypothetical protein